MLTIIDYGVGNVLAFANVFTRLNVPFVIAKNAADLVNATKLILPGVGSFDFAMQTLNQSGMRSELERMVIEKRVPVIGICVGMQMLADSSEEGQLPGLGWIKGTVRQFKFEKELNLTMPHMGWNDVTPSVSSPLFNGLEKDSIFYFLHSYYFDADEVENVLSVSNYGFDFHSSVHKDNIYGVQFHPEKSHSYGHTLLKNFSEL